MYFFFARSRGLRAALTMQKRISHSEKDNPQIKKGMGPQIKNL